MTTDEPAPRKWLHSRSRRSHSTLAVLVSSAAVPGDPNVMYTRPGSIAGVGDAYELNAWANCGFSTSKSFTSWMIFPVSRSSASAES